MPVVLHGYHYSVYVRIARMALLEKRVSWQHVEVDPFEDIPASYLALNPFGRVPTLEHDGFVLFETSAIIRYVDEAFDGPRLQPKTPRERARMNQIIAIIDSYGYWPMVRQVFAQRIFAPAIGNAGDEAMIADGIAKSQNVLSALENLASGGAFLVGSSLSLADLHLAAMIAYFTAAPEGARSLSTYPKLSSWWSRMAQHASLVETDPGLPSKPA
ncbi:glutathione S-transferase family protein [Mesorhizobium sp. SB112]|uniref:glutathione S-transferase family protein n=1 Tax=Mesorhizobium sp. SB112 TaxID=3151853 RepID=UPI0032669770